AEAERRAYRETDRQLVGVDSGTGQADGLGQLSALLAERQQALGAQVRSAPASASAGDNMVATLDRTRRKRLQLMFQNE
ncbi:glutamate carboxypeptidase, partial [Pseudomonas aeruginosa]